jgi:hypothetical protein
VTNDDTGADRSVFRAADGVVFERIDGSALVISLETNRMFELDPAGARLWEILVAGDHLEDAKGALLEEYDVAPDVLAADVGELIERLESEGLLLRVTRP